jgi:hypothetical protein
VLGLLRKRAVGGISSFPSPICLNWIHLAKDRDQLHCLEKLVINPLVLYEPGNFLSECTISVSRMTAP